ncbi:MAG TPA: TatD family hydrolase [Flavisolibacter sp.]|jgi:TatD DNase family protein|nr:TatD family hydrolase [Flavisolibacter sp.]
MYFIDTHTHIYLPEFDDDRNVIMQRAKDLNVEITIMPAIDSSTHSAMITVESTYENCYAMIGLHPCSVNQNYERELSIVRDYLAKRKFIAIGEIGLDFYWDKTFTKEQFDAFRQQIAIALQHNLPIVIHSRNAIDECIDIVSEHTGVKGVFHCFSGNEEQARKIIDLDFMLGIGGVATFKNAGLDKVIEKIGLGNVILETDAPYLAPVPYRGKRNEPAYTKLVAEKISAICNVPVKQVAELTTANAKNLFKLP